MSSPMEPVRLLLVEDSDDDAELVLRELRRSGFDITSCRVQTSSSLREALGEEWDLVICDYSMPQLDVRKVLEAVRAKSDVPFIVVSGTVGEEAVVELMRAGANDYLLKGSLMRLAPAVAREVREGRAGAERRRAERGRDQAEESFRRIIEASPDLILVHRDGAVVYANPNTIERLRWKAAGAIEGAHLSAIVMDPDVRSHRPDATVTSGRPAPLEQRWRCTDGSTIAVEVVHCEVVFKGALATALIARDLTERHHFASAMVEMDRMAAIGILAAGIGHEINNPLAYVLANLEFVATEIDVLISELPHEARLRLEPRIVDLNQALADTSQGAQRVRTIIADLRTFSRVDETGTLVDVRQVLDASARMAAVQIRQRATIVRKYAEDVSPVLASDSRLGQVFLNLVVNAAQALPDGVAPDENRIELKVENVGEFVEVEVSDSGCGIPADVLPRIFEPFFTTKPAGQGTGLGLGICRRIVMQLGGDIRVESEVGVGTRFLVRLPRAGSRDPRTTATAP